jgi:hypothetical protein
MTDRSRDLRSRTMPEMCEVLAAEVGKGHRDALAAEFGEGHPICRAQTMLEFRAAVMAELGEQHPISRLVGGWPTVEEAKADMTIGLRFFQLHEVKDGGLAGMIAGLQGALNYLHASLPPSEHSLLLPLKHLFYSLVDLESTGHKARCFRVKRRGRADTSVIADFKARTLAISDLIMAHKACSRDQADTEAARKVSRRAKALGVATPVRLKDLESWRRRTRGRRQQSGAHERPNRNPIKFPDRGGTWIIHHRPGAVSLDRRVAAIHRDIDERLAPMFGTAQLDLNGLIRAILHKGWPD